MIKNKMRNQFNENYNKVLNWFFSFPNRELSLSELAKGLGISKKTANRIVGQLVKEGFLNKVVIGRAWRLSCNLNHSYNYTKKIWWNVSWVYESGVLEEIRKIVKGWRTIILFGNYRKGDDVESSDLDIAVEVLDDKELEIREIKSVSIGFRKNVKINLHIFNRKRIDLNLFSNIANGIILDGFLEVRA
ncbi:MAG: winged helix-turn-helix transcriptional regulator [Nanoarchaeota archaeon]|nr:winged helix-turn-helix transcriptional regulator [Nanoarchaeota archaeon]